MTKAEATLKLIRKLQSLDHDKQREQIQQTAIASGNTTRITSEMSASDRLNYWRSQATK